MRLTSQLSRSVPNDLSDDRRNFRSSPVYRSRYFCAEARAELLAWTRRNDLAAPDGHSRRAADRLRQNREVRRLDFAAFVAGYPVVPMIRPDVCSGAMLRYLDWLHDLGAVEYGLTAALEAAYNLTAKEAAAVIAYWQASRGGAR